MEQGKMIDQIVNFVESTGNPRLPLLFVAGYRVSPRWIRPKYSTSCSSV